MSPSPTHTSAAGDEAGVPALGDLGRLEAVTEAVVSGAGLPEVVRAAARALDCSLVLIDRSSSVLAVAARSSADERSLMSQVSGVETHELRVGDTAVGRLRLRARGDGPSPVLLRVVFTLIASEVERLRAPERASEAAQTAFLSALLDRTVTDRGDIVARGEELGIDLSGGGAVLVVRAHHFTPTDDDWRLRLLSVVERATRVGAHGSLAAESVADHGHVVILLALRDEQAVRRTADSLARELASTMPGFTFAIGHSRVALDPVDLHRSAHEAVLAANVAEAAAGNAEDAETQVLAFEDTGSYRLLLPAMTEDRAELQRFYAETVGPLAAYDEQYETDLVQTLETFLDCDGNVAGSAQRLFTHRHTVRYRLERVREISGLDVGSTEGRERLSLGLKTMRVLGISLPHGPAHEAGAEAGRVRRDRKAR